MLSAAFSQTRVKFLSLIALCVLLLSGCGSKGLIITGGTEMVNEKWIRGATVSAPDKDGNMVPGVKIDVPPGAIIIAPEK
jgi:hypothetical protein